MSAGYPLRNRGRPARSGGHPPEDGREADHTEESVLRGARGRHGRGHDSEAGVRLRSTPAPPDLSGENTCVRTAAGARGPVRGSRTVGPMSSSVLIRAAQQADADALAAFHVRCWRETYGDAVPEDVYTRLETQGPQQWRQRLTDPQDSATWLAVERDTGDVAGFSTAVATGPGDVRPLLLASLYVDERHQGQGLGRALLEHAVGDAPAYLWVWEDNERAQRFYERNGFRLDGARRVEEQWGGIADLRMVR